MRSNMSPIVAGLRATGHEPSGPMRTGGLDGQWQTSEPESVKLSGFGSGTNCQS